jgi:hypothetical protein
LSKWNKNHPNPFPPLVDSVMKIGYILPTGMWLATEAVLLYAISMTRKKGGEATDLS